MKQKDLWYVLEFLLLDACVFHESIASLLGIRNLSQATKPYKDFLLKEWNEILKVDYRPVFNLSIDLLMGLPSSSVVETLLEKIIELAKRIVSLGLVQRHDFMGRLYHKLLLNTTGDYYATYYTSVPAAVILSRLIVDTPHPAWQLQSLEDLKNFRVLDPACGSGTLLHAVYSAIKSKLLLGKDQIGDYHRLMLEEVLYGFDVLDYATHLTLTTLALQNPKVKISKSGIATLLYGMDDKGQIYMGSLDLLTPSLQRGQGVVKTLEEDLSMQIQMNSFDIVIMNPPFSRSSGRINIKYGFANKYVASKMRKEEEQIRKFYHLVGSGTAGIAPLFVLLGLNYLKPQGRLGMVLPQAFLNSVSWEGIRRNLLENCTIKYVVSSFDPGPPKNDSWNWSENTDLGECLIVAEKGRSEEDTDTIFINFVKKPRNSIVSIMCVNSVISMLKDIPYLEDHGYYSYNIPKASMLYAYRVKKSSIDMVDGHLQALCTFSHPEINAFILDLYRFIKQSGLFRPLTEFIEKDGIDRKAILDSFTRSDNTTTYPIVWGKTQKMNTIRLDASHIKYGIPKKGEKSQKLHQTYASDLLILEKMYLNNDALICFNVDREVLATVMWELKLKDAKYKPLLLLWLNSTFGLLLYLSVSEHSRGTAFIFKKAKLPYLYVPLIEEDLSSMLSKIENKPFSVLKNETWQLRREIDDLFVQVLEKDFKEAQNIKRIYELIKVDNIVAPVSQNA